MKKKVTSYSFENDIKPYDVDNVTFDVIADPDTGQDVSDHKTEIGTDCFIKFGNMFKMS